MEKNNLTDKQYKQIRKLYIKTWDKVYSTILTKEQKNKEGIVVNKSILFRMEEIVSAHANEFGLAALSIRLSDEYSDDGIEFDACKTLSDAKKSAIAELKKCIKKIEGLREAI